MGALPPDRIREGQGQGVGRMTKRAKARRKIGGQYVPHLADLIRSPAWRALSLSARRVLDRIESEYLRHGGRDNGSLAVTFDDFVKYGINRHAIAPAMRECVALGLLVVTQHGRAGNAEFRAPNLFLLPYLETDTSAQKWREITTTEKAETIAGAAARRPGKNKIPVSVSAKFQCRKPTPKTAFSVSETNTGSQEIPSVGNQHYFLDASHDGATGKDSGAEAKRGAAGGVGWKEHEDFPDIPEFLKRARPPN